MSRWKIIWCLLWHWNSKHSDYGRSRRCRKCAYYFRDGPSNQAKRARKHLKAANIWKPRVVA